MRNLGISFIRCAVIYGTLGMVLGIVMAASGDHAQGPTHAHINLVGWASMGLFGLVYRAWPELASGALPTIHFWGWNLGVIGMVIGLFLMFSGQMQFQVLTAISSIVLLLSMLVFVFIVFRAKAG